MRSSDLRFWGQQQVPVNTQQASPWEAQQGLWGSWEGKEACRACGEGGSDPIQQHSCHVLESKQEQPRCKDWGRGSASCRKSCKVTLQRGMDKSQSEGLQHFLYSIISLLQVSWVSWWLTITAVSVCIGVVCVCVCVCVCACVHSVMSKSLWSHLL